MKETCHVGGTWYRTKFHRYFNFMIKANITSNRKEINHMLFGFWILQHRSCFQLIVWGLLMALLGDQMVMNLTWASTYKACAPALLASSMSSIICLIRLSRIQKYTVLYCMLSNIPATLHNSEHGVLKNLAIMEDSECTEPRIKIKQVTNLRCFFLVVIGYVAVLG